VPGGFRDGYVLELRLAYLRDGYDPELGAARGQGGSGVGGRGASLGLRDRVRDRWHRRAEARGPVPASVCLLWCGLRRPVTGALRVAAAWGGWGRVAGGLSATPPGFEGG